MAASCCKTSYQRLQKLPAEGTPAEEEVERERQPEEHNVPGGGRSRRGRGGRRLRRRVVRVAGLRRRFRAVGAAVLKVIKRLREGRSHLAELFAGNYMFMQVSPSPTLPFAEKTLQSAAAAAAIAAASKSHYRHGVLAPAIGISFNVPKIAY